MSSNGNLSAVLLMGICLIYFSGCVHGISRSTVISRAQTWVSDRVPYNQSAYKDGYRTDCSGYVSMAWQLGQNYNTTGLGGSTITSSISKSDLAAGDILLKAGEHVIIFSSWANSAKTKYWGYEESSSKGAVYRQIPYSYFYKKDKFLPRRYSNIEYKDETAMTEIYG